MGICGQESSNHKSKYKYKDYNKPDDLFKEENYNINNLNKKKNSDDEESSYNSNKKGNNYNNKLSYNSNKNENSDNDESSSNSNKEENNYNNKSNYNSYQIDKESPKNQENIEKNNRWNIQSGTAYGAELNANICRCNPCLGFECGGGCYVEKTTNGDYNVGVKMSVSKDKGKNTFSAGPYAELTYNKDNGFSVGGGISAEKSVSVSKEVDINGIPSKIGFYKSNYIQQDLYRKHLCC